VSALRYLYAVADAASSRKIAESGLAGVEGGRVGAVVEGALCGATSAVPPDLYDEAPLNDHLRDLDWLAPRAAAHQAVNGRLHEVLEAVLPVSFGAIYRDDEGIRALLRSRDVELRERLAALRGRSEWIVSIERDTAAAQESAALGALELEIAAAPPGRAFLLGKRRDDVVRDERRQRDAVVAAAAEGAVAPIAERLYREPLIEGAELPAVARFSVLVARDRERDLRKAAAALERGADGAGYRVRLSGPWPAYRFGGLG
jgi:hypothetical protein